MPFVLTDVQKLDVRRHLGFGPVGDPSSPVMQGGTWAGYRFFQTMGQLEFRLNNLSTVEGQTLCGATGSPNAPTPVNPNYTDTTVSPTVTYDGYLQIANFLENQIIQSTQNFDTDKADVWTARKEESVVRQRFYQQWCIRMANYLYLAVGTPLSNMGGSVWIN